MRNCSGDRPPAYPDKNPKKTRLLSVEHPKTAVLRENSPSGRLHLPRSGGAGRSPLPQPHEKAAPRRSIDKAASCGASANGRQHAAPAQPTSMHLSGESGKNEHGSAMRTRTTATRLRTATPDHPGERTGRIPNRTPSTPERGVKEKNRKLNRRGGTAHQE